MTGTRKRIALVGAGGIGRHHAKWWHIEGADVCGFVGTSAESTARTAETLRDMFDFSGRSYTTIEDMLAAEKPDLVDVCSPNPLHARHVRQLLESHCDVLCEKPFVYDPAQSSREILRESAGLVDLAAQQHCALGLCSQYFVGAQCCAGFLRDRRGTTCVTHFEGHLASPAKGRPSDPMNVWIDLGPHMLAAVQALRPGGEIVKSTFKVEQGPFLAAAHFEVAAPGQPVLECTVRVNRTHGDPKNIRTLTLDGVEFDIQGAQGADGQYCARLVTPEGNYEADDFMRRLIRQTLAGQPPMTGRAIITNQRWLFELAPDVHCGESSE